jgi:hypothetical protein
MGFEHTVPTSAREKTFHDLDRSATVIGNIKFYLGLKYYIGMCFNDQANNNKLAEDYDRDKCSDNF